MAKLIVLLAVACTNTVDLAYSQGNHLHPFPTWNELSIFLGELDSQRAEWIGLTDAQQAELDKIRAAHQEARQMFRENEAMAVKYPGLALDRSELKELYLLESNARIANTLLPHQIVLYRQAALLDALGGGDRLDAILSHQKFLDLSLDNAERELVQSIQSKLTMRLKKASDEFNGKTREINERYRRKSADALTSSQGSVAQQILGPIPPWISR